MLIFVNKRFSLATFKLNEENAETPKYFKFHFSKS